MDQTYRPEKPSTSRQVQLVVTLPYHREPAAEPRIKAYLDRGYRIEQLQRISDREAVVLLSATN